MRVSLQSFQNPTHAQQKYSEYIYIIKILLLSLFHNQSKSITHSYGKKFPKIPFYPTSPPPSINDEDIAISQRLLSAYQLSNAKNGSIEIDDVWSKISCKQKVFFQVLNAGNATTLANYLSNLHSNDATIGFGQGYEEYIKNRFNPFRRKFYGLFVKDKLVSLAESLGALACENPEQGSFGENLHVSVDELVDRIEKKIGSSISPQNIGGNHYKLHGKTASYSERDLTAVYTALRLKYILEGKDSPSICEIGAGMGNLAYWTRKFLNCKYTIIDLPHINVVQGYYLLKSLPKESIQLFGEPTPFSHPTPLIRIFPDHAMSYFSKGEFDLVTNQDSFPEIQPEIVFNYLNLIRQIKSNWFFSINHESSPNYGLFKQNRVSDIIKTIDGFSLVQRFPFWMRSGYVEELYKIDS